MSVVSAILLVSAGVEACEDVGTFSSGGELVCAVVLWRLDAPVEISSVSTRLELSSAVVDD